MPEKGERGIGKSELHQRNVLWLVKALLLLAKPTKGDDLKLEDSQLTTAVKVRWVAEDTLKVTGEYKEKTRRGEKVVEGTTKQALWQLVEKTDTPLELPQRQGEGSSCTKQERQDDAVRNALRYLEYLGVWKDERPKNKRNTRYWIFTLTLKHKDALLEENLGVVKQKLGLETSPLEEDAGTLPLSFWQGCCRKMLPTALSINPLLHGDGVALTIEDIVPLELVERKQRPQQKEDFSPEQFQIQAPIEYEVPVEHNKFLVQVLETGDSLKNRDRKIAVIGEPGAGKTTLLQEIAKEVEGAGGLPIFVRLADLGEKTLKDYLLEDWLEEATGKRRISDDIQEDFVQQFNLGRVWLLLDGVDEIAGSSVSVGARHVVPLQMIASQLKGWVSEARIVLTCRLNVWDVGKNDLYAFEKYRIQQLSYPDLVGDFIRRFFSKAGTPTKGEKLIEKLERSQPRIRDLVKNPLRLTLLCRIWKRRQGELPQTKAELYKGFVETFYEWKDKPEIAQEKRLILEQALGELAKNAIDKETTKFRLRESFVRQELGKFDKSLFDLACRVSWINNVGVASENQDETVYAFFHPTFQEYFAALAISDWHDFLNHIPHNPEQGTYRLFEPQWKEVILLWLGRPHEEVAKEHKEEFIKKLVEFEDGCKNFYGARAYFLATAGIAECVNCTLADTVVEQTVDWCFGVFDENTQTWRRYRDPIPWLAQEALLETDPKKAIKIIVQKKISAVTNAHQYSPSIQEVGIKSAEILGFLGTNRSEAINALIQLIINENSDFVLVQSKASKSLVKIGTGNKDAIDSLTDKLEFIQDKRVKITVALTLGKLEFGNPSAINCLTALMSHSQNPKIRLQAAWSLLEIYPGHQIAISTIEELSRSQNKNISFQANTVLEQGTVITYQHNEPEDYSPEEISVAQEAWNNSNSVFELLREDKPELARREAICLILESADCNYTETIAALVEQLNICKDTSSLRLIIEILGKVAIGDENVVQHLIHFMQTHRPVLAETPRALSKILQDDLFSLAVVGLKDYLQNEDYKSNPFNYEQIHQVIWYCARKMNYPAFHRAWHQQEGVGQTTTSDSQSLNQDD